MNAHDRPGMLPSAAALLLAMVSIAATAQAPTASGIFTCTTADGRRMTSDRSIPECAGREQRVLNRDGSLQRVVPPALTGEERAARDAQERKAEQERQAANDAVRRDRNLMARYPDEAAHQRAREAALDTPRQAMRTSEARIAELASERKALQKEAEFYAGKPLPPKLKQQVDANDAATQAQREAIQNQRHEMERIEQLYDAEFVRLKRLWAGASPGFALEPSAAGASAKKP